MWRLYLLRRVLREYELLEVGLAMLDGSYWQPENTFPPAEAYFDPGPICGDC